MINQIINNQASCVAGRLVDHRHLSGTCCCFGWISVCGASYTYGDNDIFSLGTRSGMQIVWIGTSHCLGFVILMMDDRFFDTFSLCHHMRVLILLLFATIFNPHTSRVRTPGSCSDRSDCSLPSSVSLLRLWL